MLAPGGWVGGSDNVCISQVWKNNGMSPGRLSPKPALGRTVACSGCIHFCVQAGLPLRKSPHLFFTHHPQYSPSGKSFQERGEDKHSSEAGPMECSCRDSRSSCQGWRLVAWAHASEGEDDGTGGLRLHVRVMCLLEKYLEYPLCCASSPLPLSVLSDPLCT